jgi:ankyrin repeat protein
LKHKQDVTDEQRKEREEVLKNWINTSTKGEEGFTAMHFASFHGNISLIETLLGQGGNVNVKNKQDINMMHVAAQGD